ncbi:MAG: hypoxanthine phosphoribosyltransferase [Deltaproteobacteria bacterium]|nr:hypoxanthine phosphoribosyltransferase [Deltaproteobacteria bacterium]MBW2017816.1 hypoxanthine phosphoribosyltransferase [Deltaproteobacteria bacterium]MBW2128476.1 hypoxanthine phosphoribosyltransferase [Deltaproteobacteria bacterium]MBW2303665.1 hypoxanthine phosphoribosyltransferase [Deltaproteobacteria bacterium]
MKKELLFDRKTIFERVQGLAREISSEYAGKEPVVIGVLNGAVFFLTDLVRELDIPSVIDFIKASSYGSRMQSSGSVALTKDVEIPLEGRDVILVEDIVDTGLTLKKILEHLEGKSPSSIKVCALIDKLERREEQINIDYWGFRVDKGFLVGYGLDFNEQYRSLPGIYTLE